MQKSLHLDPNKCTGCLQCEMACAWENYRSFTVAKSRIKVFTFHHEGRFVPYTCTQCDEAWCLIACPVEAIRSTPPPARRSCSRPTCVGCKVCTIACPFGTINYVSRRARCRSATSATAPGLRKACPTGAITYVDADWTGLGRCASGPAGPTRTRRRHEERLPWHGPERPSREPRGRHLHHRAPEHAWAHEYLGQRGLATKYLVSEIDPGSTPSRPTTSSSSTGPLTGTMAATGGRYSVVTKGPLTGAIACSNSGGYFGAELKFAGWDMVIFEGASPKPVYLLITDGRPSWWTPAISGARPSGRPRSRSRSPPGSPDPRGGHRPGGREPRPLRLHRERPAPGGRAVRRGRGDGFQEPQGRRRPRHPHRCLPPRGPRGVHRGHRGREEGAGGERRDGAGAPAYGTQVLMNVINELGALPTRNHREVQFEGARRHLGRGDAPEAVHRRQGEPRDQRRLLRLHHRLRPHLPHGPRPLHRQGQARVPRRLRRRGVRGRLGAGRRQRRVDLEALTYANFLCNEDGFDPISFGATVGAAMELYDLGILTKEEVGFELPFGSAEADGQLAEMTARARASARRSGWVRSGFAPSTAGPNSP
jgi:Fe-S-cluster-containing hydrogenase component 2